MHITVGDVAPSFVLPAYVRGRRKPEFIDLADARGQWVVLAFYPRDFSSAHASDLTELAALAPAFGAEHALIIASSTASHLSHRRWFEHHPQLRSVNYPILADARHDLARAFGALAPDGSCRRAQFVIDPEGVVQHASFSNGPAAREAMHTLRVLTEVRNHTWRALLAA